MRSGLMLSRATIWCGAGPPSRRQDPQDLLRRATTADVARAGADLDRSNCRVPIRLGSGGSLADLPSRSCTTFGGPHTPTVYYQLNGRGVTWRLSSPRPGAIRRATGSNTAPRSPPSAVGDNVRARREPRGQRAATSTAPVSAELRAHVVGTTSAGAGDHAILDDVRLSQPRWACAGGAAGRALGLPACADRSCSA